MKHTKKMLMVPESEYLTLLGMVKGRDSLGMEKAETNIKIQKTLNDPKINEDLRAKRYNWLFKKRQQLKGEIENRPQKVVVMKNPKGANASMPPYVNPTPPVALVPQESDNDYEYDTAADVITPVGIKPKKRKAKTAALLPSTPHKAIISKEYYEDIHDYVEQNLEKFRIHEDGKIESNLPGRKIKESDYKRVIDYLTGEASSPGKGFKFLYGRLTKDPIVNEMIENSKEHNTSNETSDTSYTGSSSEGQSGRGRKRNLQKQRRPRKHVIVKSAANISPSSSVKNKFIPQIWERL